MSEVGAVAEFQPLVTHMSRNARRAVKLIFAKNIVVPKSYSTICIDHLDGFLVNNACGLRMRRHSPLITHHHFKNPQHQLVAGREVSLRFYKVGHGYHLSPQRCLAFWKNHGSMFSEAQTLAMICHCVVDGQLSVKELTIGKTLVAPCQKFSPSVVGGEAAGLYVGLDGACDLIGISPKMPIDETRVLIVVESISQNK